ncbi:DUF6906 family protein [Rossellomorea sp. H39__3]
MKNGKKPTRNQFKTLIEAGLNPRNWLITKNLKQDRELVLVHRDTGTTRKIPQ